MRRKEVKVSELEESLCSNEIVEHILLFVSVEQLGSVAMVCSSWRGLLSVDSFWKKVHGLRYGGPKPDKQSWKQAVIEAAREISKLRKIDQLEQSSMFPAADSGIRISSPSGDTAPRIPRSTGRQSSIGFRISSQQWTVPCTSKAWTLMFGWAVHKGHYRVVRQLLGSPKPLEQPTAFSKLLSVGLLTAAKLGHLGVVQELVKYQPALVLRASSNPSGWTALFHAAQGGHVGVVQWLLEQEGIDPAQQDPDGWTALMVAIRHGCPAALVQHYVARAAAAADVADRDGWTPLMVAAQLGRDDVVQTLLTAGRPDPSRADGCGWTALHYAAQDGSVAVVSALLTARNVAVDARDGDGATPLLVAVANGHTAVVEQLLRHGADASATDGRGRTALMIAAEAGQSHEALWRALTAAVPASLVEARCHRGMTALAYGCEAGAEAVVERLVRQGANVDSRDDEGATPLMVAARAGHAALVERLLRCGADHTAVTSKGWSALSYACQQGHTDIVQSLLAADGKAAQPYRPLHLRQCLLVAALNRHLDAAHALLPRLPRLEEHRMYM